MERKITSLCVAHLRRELYERLQRVSHVDETKAKRKLQVVVTVVSKFVNNNEGVTRKEPKQGTSRGGTSSLDEVNEIVRGSSHCTNCILSTASDLLSSSTGSSFRSRYGDITSVSIFGNN